MKKLRLFLSLCVALFSVACSYNELPENLKTTATIEDKTALNVETRAETYEGKELDQEYFVTATDLENFVNFRSKESDRSNFSVREVKSYGFDSSQTLFYILNYDKGWEVVAADKRVQPTLAHGDDGTFTMDTDNEPMKFWMNMLAEGVLKTRQTSDIATRTTADNAEEETTDVNQHLKFWEIISPSKNSTRGGLTPIWGPLLPADSIGIGIRKKYYLPNAMDSYSESTYYGPYIETSWGQGSPWNVCCPISATYNGDTAYYLVGCVAVSVGQMLYFLQNKFANLSLLSYENVIYTMNNTVYERVGPSYDLWDDMATYYYTIEDPETGDDIEMTDGNTRYVAALLSHVGILLDMEYDLGESNTTTLESKEKVFEPYGISCYYGIYSASTVINQLQNRGIPVIIRGSLANNIAAHSWIIDGYYTFSNIIKKYYIYSTQELTQEELIGYTKEDADGFDTITYNSEGDFHMNWGWSDGSNGWYAKTVGWTPSGHTNETYNTDINILYGFTN